MKVPKKQNVNKKVDSSNKSRSMVVIPYVQEVSERVARVYKSYGIAAAMKPHNTLRKELVHPKDKIRRISPMLYMSDPVWIVNSHALKKRGENSEPLWRSIRLKWKKSTKKLSPDPDERNPSPPHINLPSQTMW